MKKIFFYIFRIKENAGKIFLRVTDWAAEIMANHTDGDFFQPIHIEGKKMHSRRLFRIEGLKYTSYPGIKEGLVIKKTNLETHEIDLQYFITNRPPEDWDAKSILDRILLHWDTETGVFGIKDNTFHEDRARYQTIEGVKGHVACLNIAWNCLSAPILEQYWLRKPMSYRIQLFKDHPDLNPFTLPPSLKT